jgi:ribosomal-protein-alanine N-acetyltransferase
MAVILETPRLLLRTWTLADVADAFEIWGNSEVMRFVGPPLPSVQATVGVLERAIAAQEAHGVSLWAVIEKVSQGIIGCCGFHMLSCCHGESEFELAYHFKPAHWHRGYASEAVRACLQHGFEKLNARRIVASTYPQNEASWRMLERAGFRHKGIELREGKEEKVYDLSGSHMIEQ